MKNPENIEDILKKYRNINTTEQPYFASNIANLIEIYKSFFTTNEKKATQQSFCEEVLNVFSESYGSEIINGKKNLSTDKRRNIYMFFNDTKKIEIRMEYILGIDEESNKTDALNLELKKNLEKNSAFDILALLNGYSFKYFNIDDLPSDTDYILSDETLNSFYVFFKNHYLGRISHKQYYQLVNDIQTYVGFKINSFLKEQEVK